MGRVTRSHRPDDRVVGYQSWSELLFLHWSVDPHQIAELLPPSLTADTFDGRAWVGLVPFAMRHVRPSGVPAAAGFDFLESNVRTYVHHRGDAPGVWFFSLDAASRIAVTIARLRWSLPYFHAAMRLDVAPDATHRYQARRSGAPSTTLDVHYRPGPPLGPSRDGTLEHFLVERYYLYCERHGTLHRGQVHHTPYPLHAAEVLALEDHFVAAAGVPIEGPPETTHWSPGVDVEIFPLRPVGG